MTVNVIHGLPIICTDIEINTFAAPAGTTCAEYMAPYFAAGAFGYLQTGADTSNCGYCRYSTGDQFTTGLGMNYSHRWRDFGLMWAYILFNAFLTVVLFYVFRIWKFKFGKGTSKTAGKAKQADDAVQHKIGEGGAGAAEVAGVAPRTDVRANVDNKSRGQSGTSGP